MTQPRFLSALFVWVSFTVGIVGGDKIEEYFRLALNLSDENKWVIWLVVVFVLFLAFLVELVCKVIYTKNRKKELRDVLGICEAIEKQLESLEKEYLRETTFDVAAWKALGDSTDMTMKLVRDALNNVVMERAKRFAQRPWCLMKSVDSHLKSEVKDPMKILCMAGKSHSSSTKPVIWGIKCATMLVQQVRDEVLEHPHFLN